MNLRTLKKVLMTIACSPNLCCRSTRGLSTLKFTMQNSMTRILAPPTFFYNDVYEVPLPATHRFPMAKYRLVRERLQDRIKWVNFEVSPVASYSDLTTTHSTEYVSRFLTGNLTSRENRNIGFPWSSYSVNRALSSVGGTLQAMHAVCSTNFSNHTNVPLNLISGHIAGGTHHAFFDRGEGFCVFSDIAVAANVALRDYESHIRRILIVDLDVHQGNGNAVLFSNNDKVFTFSMHCKANYFSNPEKSDIDVELESGTGDEEYLRLLEYWIPKLMKDVRPDLIFYQAGIDSLHCDRLGKLNLSQSGLSRRNHLMFETVLNSSTRMVITMGGGYPKDMTHGSEDYEEIVTAHANVYIDAAMCLQRAKHLTVKSVLGG